MTEERMAQAWQHHCDGVYSEAETLCREIVSEEAENVGAWRLLAEACLAQGKYEDTVKAYRNAKRRILLGPCDLNNLGVALLALGRLAEAEDSYREAIALRPDYLRCLINLGVALFKQEKLEEAATCFRSAIKSNPDEPGVYDGLAHALVKAEKADEAVQFLEEALRSNPHRAEAHHARGLAQAALGEWDEAAQSHRRALELQPDFAEAYCNLGTALLALDRLEDSVACFRRAIEMKPTLAEGHHNLATVLAWDANPDEALGCFQEALRLQPDYTECRVNRATTLLLHGDYERGWVEFESRWRGTNFDRQMVRPPWDGRPLEGRTILLIAEQGLGDTLHFVRYAPLVKERGGKVVVACQKPLLTLLESCSGIDQLVAHDDIRVDFDVFALFMSLPRILGTTLQTLPANIPYLHARPELVESWGRRLRHLGGFLVGVGWQGNPKYCRDRQRSFRLAEFEPLAGLPGVTLVSLQQGPESEQVPRVSDRFPIVALTDRTAGEARTFLDTAAIVNNLDLVIGCDSALVHLAGALGAPVWVAQAFFSDWRWLLGREDSPWYPTARLFRQQRPGDWEGVFNRMAQTLSDQLAACPNRMKAHHFSAESARGRA
jgi:tetratricopeptide (TPR) repeat protein